MHERKQGTIFNPCWTRIPFHMLQRKTESTPHSYTAPNRLMTRIASPAHSMLTVPSLAFIGRTVQKSKMGDDTERKLTIVISRQGQALY